MSTPNDLEPLLRRMFFDMVSRHSTIWRELLKQHAVLNVQPFAGLVIPKLVRDCRGLPFDYEESGQLALQNVDRSLGWFIDLCPPANWTHPVAFLFAEWPLQRLSALVVPKVGLPPFSNGETYNEGENTGLIYRQASLSSVKWHVCSEC